jgi:hypothetical protein
MALGLHGEQRVVYHAPGTFTLHDISEPGDVLVSLDPPAGGLEILGEGLATQDFTWREGGILHDFSDTHAVLFSTVDSGGPRGSVFVWQPSDRLPVRIADGVGVALSPDGSQALVSTTGNPRQASIVPTGAGRPRPLDLGDFESLHWAAWLPDGRLVVEVARAGANTTVEVLSPDGGAAATLLPEGATLRGGRLISPDGSRIVAFSADQRLEVCTLATPGCRPLAGARDGDVVAGWTADAKAIFVYRQQDAVAQVDRLVVDSGARSAWRTVRPTHATANGIAWLVAAPDGTLAYSYLRTRSQLFVIHGLK